MTKAELELAIDAHGLCAILEAIAGICGEKAMHIEETWQDRPLAAQWAKAADIVETAAAKIEAKLLGVQAGHAALA